MHGSNQFTLSIGRNECMARWKKDSFGKRIVLEKRGHTWYPVSKQQLQLRKRNFAQGSEREAY